MLYLTANTRLTQELIKRQPDLAANIISAQEFLYECWQDCQDSAHPAFTRRIIDHHYFKEIWIETVASSKYHQNIDTQRLADTSFNSLTLAYEWDLSLDASDLDDDQLFFADCFRRFDQRLEDDQLIAPVMLAAALVKLNAQNYLSRKPGQVRALGFIDMPVALANWIRQLNESSVDIAPNGTASFSDSFMSSADRLFDRQTEESQAPTPIVSAQTFEEELRHTAKHILQLEESHHAKHEFQRYTVVIPDLSQQLDTVLRVFAEELEDSGISNHHYPISNQVFDVTIGRPLTKIPLVQAALCYSDPKVFPVLSSAASHLSYEKPESKALEQNSGLPRESWLTLLDLEYRQYKNQALVSKLLQILRSRSQPTIQNSEIARIANDIAQTCQSTLKVSDSTSSDAKAWDINSDSLLATLFKDLHAHNGNKSRSRYHDAEALSRVEHIGRLKRHLELLGWPGANLKAHEFHAQAKFFDVLNEMRASSDKRQSFASFHQDLTRRLENTVFHPPSMNKRVHICTDVDAIGVPHDHLFILGCSTSQFPGKVLSHPFLPRSVLRKAGYTRHSYEGCLDHANKILNNYQSSAQKVYYSYVGTVNGQAQQVSPIVPGAEYHRQTELKTSSASDCAARALLQNALIFDSFESYQGGDTTPLANYEKIAGGSYGVKLYLQNPFIYFAQYRLGINADEPVTTAIPRSEWGKIMHHALEKIYSEDSDVYISANQRASGNDLQELSLQIEKALRDALQRQSPRLVMQLSEPVINASLQGGARIIAEWMRYEQSRESFQICSLEQEFEIKVLSHATTHHTLSLRIDRIDEIHGATPDSPPAYAIMDYKTGGVPSYSSLFGDHVSEPQAALYHYALKQQDPSRTISHIGFAQLKKDELKHQYLSMPIVCHNEDSADQTNYALYRSAKASKASQPNSTVEEQWTSLIEQTLADIAAGKASLHNLDMGDYHTHLEGLARSHCTILETVALKRNREQ